jgi:hypothetical protein
VEADVGVAAQALDPAEDRVVGGGAAPGHVHDRGEGHGHQQRLQDPDGDHPGHGDGGDGDLALGVVGGQGNQRGRGQGGHAVAHLLRHAGILADPGRLILTCLG